MRNVTFYALRNKIYMVFDALEAKSSTAFSDVITVTFSNMLNATKKKGICSHQQMCFGCCLYWLWSLEFIGKTSVAFYRVKPEPKQH